MNFSPGVMQMQVFKLIHFKQYCLKSTFGVKITLNWVDYQRFFPGRLEPEAVRCLSMIARGA